jgi:hypothetical protein
MAAREEPIQAPRPAFISLPAAVKAAIAHGNGLADIRPEAWGRTYNCSSEYVRQEWERQQSSASLIPSNSFDVEGK